MTESECEDYRRRWDELRSTGNRLDFDRATLLLSLYERNRQDRSVLASVMVSVLDEYPGKRVESFIRMALALAVVSDESTWLQIGGHGVVLLSRLPGTSRRRIMTKVRAVLRRTGRGTISASTYRTVVVSVVGGEDYRRALTERKRESSLRSDFTTLKLFLLTLIRKDKAILRKMPRQVQRLLGLDLVMGRRRAS